MRNNTKPIRVEKAQAISMYLKKEFTVNKEFFKIIN